jgi:hypothetical protein
LLEVHVVIPQTVHQIATLEVHHIDGVGQASVGQAGADGDDGAGGDQDVDRFGG